MTNLNFINSPFFDYGALDQISNILEHHNIKKPLICSDPGIKDAGLLDKLNNQISNKFSPILFDKTPANPTEEAVLIALEAYKSEGCDGVIGFGGGSSIDLAKAVCLMANHSGCLSDYSANEGGMEKIKKTAPLIAIPTTSGTGSEVSSGSVIVMNDGRKLILVSKELIPASAICDPSLTLGLPTAMTAGGGMDALTHCIEAILSPVIDPPAEGVGLDGIEKVVREGNLIKAVQDGSNTEARWNMMMAATEGAMAFTKGLGAVHSMSHALGANQELRLHHGTLNGVILPTILRFNYGHVGNKYERIARAMGKDESVDLSEEIEKLNQQIGLPANLKEMGVTNDMIPGLVEHSMADVCNFTNPRSVTVQDYEKLFMEAIG
ncbi:MAG: iron-containing alcohol dehydrogenase [SAR86 cluster bacterium]|jgi:4-hydroxybutyrate dehydrogenase|nr:iron-containing alcohol dehydrogenase [SAR86 cluster bacterium]|tara:strand:- start:5041 stop:6177 length:1137 start_codon:yes stop_codon:yes gene_type:complete